MPKKLLLITIFANAAYLIWLGFHVTGVLGFVFYGAEIAIGSLSLLFLINHWSQKHTFHTDGHAEGTVDIFLPIVDEPVSIFQPVLASVSAIRWSQKKIYVLDDGEREEVRALARRHGAEYLRRPDARANGKAGNLNYGIRHSSGDFILVIDADQKVTDPTILKETIGHFCADPLLAVLATRQRFNVPHADFNHDILFYEHMQSGKNNDNAAISCGSGAIYRREALDGIGGFPTWNIVEDLYTTYLMHAAGYRSLYINKSYTLGTAPLDLAGIYKQRGVWALDTIRMFFKDSPLAKRGLTWRQKLHYAELTYAYLVSAFAIPVISVMPIVTLLFPVRFIDDPFFYMLFRMPSLALLLWLYYRLSGNSFSTGQYWAALWPVFLKAFFLSFKKQKPAYRVTLKVGTGRRDTRLVIPHMTIAGAGLFAVGYHLGAVGLTLTLLVNSLWIGLTTFWYAPVIYKGTLKE
ncbi:MAG: glycosyltransferase [Patescibacteria group bacterium]